MKRSLTILAIFLAILAAALPAQATKVGALLVFVDGPDLTVKRPDGTVFDLKSGGVMMGDSIPVGSIIITGARTTAELRLVPNKSVIKLAKATQFTVEKLAATDASGTNAFAVGSGKIRMVAAKLSGEGYQIRTPSAVCGVRGTDFSLSVFEGLKDRLFVNEGAVDFSRLVGGLADLSSQVIVGAGQYVEALRSGSGAFSVLPATDAIFSEEFGDMDIPADRLSEVLGTKTELALAPSPAPTATQAATPAPDSSGSSDASGSDIPDGTREGDTGGTAIAAPTPAPTPNPLMEWLTDVLNMEIGSVTIDDKVWAKAVLQPNIVLGKVRAGLFLPIIYSTNIFDPADWYRPNGNDEWSFGFDYGWKENTLGALGDAASDLALKIRYFEYGNQKYDNFFVKVGNFKGITLGHGILMSDYANDSGFPAIRRVGLDLGFNLANKAKFGAELISNDLSRPELYGGRLLFRPFKNSKFGVGLSGVVDWSPASMLNTEAEPAKADQYGNPVITGVGLDFDLPVFANDLIAMKLYADAGAIVPYFRTAFSGIDAGYRWQVLWNDAEARPDNFGAVGGVMMTILTVLDLQLDFRYMSGTFRPNYFDKSYDSSRGTYAAQTATLIASPPATSPVTMGVYGEGSMGLFDDKLLFSLGYLWPWNPALGADVQAQLDATEDYLHAGIEVKQGLIPNFNVGGSIGYDRRGFVQAIVRGDLDGLTVMEALFDQNTSFRGELILPVPNTPLLDLAFIFSTAPARDENGDVVFIDAAGTRPSMVPVMAIETRFHF